MSAITWRRPSDDEFEYYRDDNGRKCRRRKPSPLSGFEALLAGEIDAVHAMLLEKNRAYGNSALDPVRCFSRADAIEQIRVRLDDKISRLMRGQDAGEDVELDLIGYLFLLRIARRRAGADWKTALSDAAAQALAAIQTGEVSIASVACDAPLSKDRSRVERDAASPSPPQQRRKPARGRA